jgi:hypothetical protein
LSHQHGTGAEKCTRCSRPASCKDYLVVKEGYWKPIEELSGESLPRDQLAMFCSHKCLEKVHEVLICPNCKTFEYNRSTGADYPDPKSMLDMTAQHNTRMLQRKHKKRDTTQDDHSLSGAHDKEQEEDKMWPREPRRIRVPICVTCSATMLPRNPLAPHLRMPRVQYA